MTALEAKILGFMEVEVKPISTHRLARQFDIGLGALEVILNALKRHCLVEQDGIWYRLRAGAGEAITDYHDRFKYEPFSPARGWR